MAGFIFSFFAYFSGNYVDIALYYFNIGAQCNYISILLYTYFISRVQDFKPPKRPFRRMDYAEAIKYLKEHDIRKDDGTFYEFGEVSNAIRLVIFFYLLIRVHMCLTVV